jgi:hypothetical protein
VLCTESNTGNGRKKNNQKVMFFFGTRHFLCALLSLVHKHNGVGSRFLHVDARKGRRPPQLKTSVVAAFAWTASPPNG